jgi:hypothetical protein
MRINMSSRELRGALSTFIAASNDLHTTWDAKLVHATALRAFIDTAKDLADELEHPEYDHARATRLARELFDAGLALVKIVDEELANTADVAPLRAGRCAALAMMQTIAGYLSPLAGLRAA